MSNLENGLLWTEAEAAGGACGKGKVRDSLNMLNLKHVLDMQMAV